MLTHFFIWFIQWTWIFSFKKSISRLRRVAYVNAYTHMCTCLRAYLYTYEHT